MNLCDHPDHGAEISAPPEAIVGVGGPGGVVWLCGEHWEDAMRSLGEWLRALKAALN